MYINFRIFLITLLAWVPSLMWGVNAYPGILSVRQPDGKEIQIRLAGNEFDHRFFTPEGVPLVMNEAGYYVLASDEDLEILAANRNLKRENKMRGPGLMSSYYPTLGEQKALVILVEFADNRFSMDDPNDYYTRMLNEEGFSDNGGTGSAREYFIENSSGLFIPSFDVYGPVKLSETIEFYGENDRWGDDTNPMLMVIEACRLLDNQIDFTEYDRNKDGIIDNVFIYYAGYGENDGGGAKTIWPHSSKLSLLYKEKIYLDGVQLDRYACTNELHSPQRNGLPDGIGTFCHEFGHVLGLPDLYATTFINLETPGEWDVMDTGNYNNEGNTPANLSSFERYALDWLSPKQFENGVTVLEPLDQSNEAYIYHCANPDEYFMFENRQQQGFDSFLPGHGMLVWQINYDSRVWEQNVVNNSFLEQYVDLIEADGLGGLGTRDGDPFPGTKENTEFSSSSYPRFKGKSQSDIPVALTDISETEDGIVTFVVSGSSETSGVNFNCLNSKDIVEQPIYDLTGRKVHNKNLKKGVYIQNGRKVIF